MEHICIIFVSKYKEAILSYLQAGLNDLDLYLCSGRDFGSGGRNIGVGDFTGTGGIGGDRSFCWDGILCH